MEAYTEKEKKQREIDNLLLNIESLKKKKNERYRSVQDMTVDAITTQKAIESMKKYNLEIGKIQRKIKLLEKEINKL